MCLDQAVSAAVTKTAEGLVKQSFSETLRRVSGIILDHFGQPTVLALVPQFRAKAAQVIKIESFGIIFEHFEL